MGRSNEASALTLGENRKSLPKTDLHVITKMSSKRSTELMAQEATNDLTDALIAQPSDKLLSEPVLRDILVAVQGCNKLNLWLMKLHTLKFRNKCFLVAYESRKNVGYELVAGAKSDVFRRSISPL